jgi:hypothetical protein
MAGALQSKWSYIKAGSRETRKMKRWRSIIPLEGVPPVTSAPPTRPHLFKVYNISHATTLGLILYTWIFGVHSSILLQ